ncbi:E3 ubiquitin-protein ligase SINA-like 10 isoform X2 [Triticum aestivum]|uniref:E3 ubiquitin-protein ligase SINA-like 10 isoform X2 n=1 Tax=Triticum aestivum TaxID=4565 RepID=UPI001D02EF14|nr:E3 ubiquitin-protein ligase SINA-like 10 isoform X2 [Triticum aestivum]
MPSELAHLSSAALSVSSHQSHRITRPERLVGRAERHESAGERAMDESAGQRAMEEEMQSGDGEREREGEPRRLEKTNRSAASNGSIDLDLLDCTICLDPLRPPLLQGW